MDRKAECPHAPVVLVKEYRRSGVAFLYAGTWRSPQALTGEPVFR